MCGVQDNVLIRVWLVNGLKTGESFKARKWASKGLWESSLLGFLSFMRVRWKKKKKKKQGQTRPNNSSLIVHNMHCQENLFKLLRWQEAKPSFSSCWPEDSLSPGWVRICQRLLNHVDLEQREVGTLIIKASISMQVHLLCRLWLVMSGEGLGILILAWIFILRHGGGAWGKMFTVGADQGRGSVCVFVWTDQNFHHQWNRKENAGEFGIGPPSWVWQRNISMKSKEPAKANCYHQAQDLIPWFCKKMYAKWEQQEPAEQKCLEY